MAGVTDAPTMASVLTSHNANSNAYLSGLGLAEAFFGRVQKVDGMTEHASELYGQSLRNLRDDLQLTDQKVARSRAYMNLWSCVFLGLYEIVAASGQSSWMQHSKGMGILVSRPDVDVLPSTTLTILQTELLGPTNFQSPIANTILDMNRSFIVCLACLPTLLSALINYRLQVISLSENAAFSAGPSGKPYHGNTGHDHGR